MARSLRTPLARAFDPCTNIAVGNGHALGVRFRMRAAGRHGARALLPLERTNRRACVLRKYEAATGAGRLRGRRCCSSSRSSAHEGRNRSGAHLRACSAEPLGPRSAARAHARSAIACRAQAPSLTLVRFSLRFFHRTRAAGARERAARRKDVFHAPFHRRKAKPRARHRRRAARAPAPVAHAHRVRRRRRRRLVRGAHPRRLAPPEAYGDAVQDVAPRAPAHRSRASGSSRSPLPSSSETIERLLQTADARRARGRSRPRGAAPRRRGARASSATGARSSGFSIRDLSPEAVRSSLGALEPNAKYRPLYESALARQRADWLYGMNMTRLYTLLGRAAGYQGVLSVGRVQTPLLGLIVARDRAIAEFRPVAYYVVAAEIRAGGEERFRATWVPPPEAPTRRGRAPARRRSRRRPLARACSGKRDASSRAPRQEDRSAAPALRARRPAGGRGQAALDERARPCSTRARASTRRIAS